MEIHFSITVERSSHSWHLDNIFDTEGRRADVTNETEAE